MALTVSVTKKATAGNTRQRTGTITFDSSYPTGGEALVYSDLGFGSSIDFIVVHPTAGYVFEYDYTNHKLLAYRQKDPAATGGADIALPQVGNTVDLSAVVARFYAVEIYNG